MILREAFLFAMFLVPMLGMFLSWVVYGGPVDYWEDPPATRGPLTPEEWNRIGKGEEI